MDAHHLQVSQQLFKPTRAGCFALCQPNGVASGVTSFAAFGISDGSANLKLSCHVGRETGLVAFDVASAVADL
jgi:hypothetical protein